MRARSSARAMPIPPNPAPTMATRYGERSGMGPPSSSVAQLDQADTVFGQPFVDVQEEGGGRHALGVQFRAPLRVGEDRFRFGTEQGAIRCLRKTQRLNAQAVAGQHEF